MAGNAHKTAFENGANAAESGKTTRSNPYKNEGKSRGFYNSWTRGFESKKK